MRLAGSLTGLFLALLLALAPATREQGRGREEQAKDFGHSVKRDKAFIKKEPLKT